MTPCFDLQLELFHRLAAGHAHACTKSRILAPHRAMLLLRLEQRARAECYSVSARHAKIPIPITPRERQQWRVAAAGWGGDIDFFLLRLSFRLPPFPVHYHRPSGGDTTCAAGGGTPDGVGGLYDGHAALVCESSNRIVIAAVCPVHVGSFDFDVREAHRKRGHTVRRGTVRAERCDLRPGHDVARRGKQLVLTAVGLGGSRGTEEESAVEGLTRVACASARTAVWRVLRRIRGGTTTERRGDDGMKEDRLWLDVDDIGATEECVRDEIDSSFRMGHPGGVGTSLGLEQLIKRGAEQFERRGMGSDGGGTRRRAESRMSGLGGVDVAPIWDISPMRAPSTLPSKIRWFVPHHKTSASGKTCRGNYGKLLVGVFEEHLGRPLAPSDHATPDKSKLAVALQVEWVASRRIAAKVDEKGNNN
ncbi:hypothetical protein BJV74DRAFT_795047 [Russula compacta]|nr:hypothetical protein BJV74DRAFT_795047 [Russula compacta]